MSSLNCRITGCTLVIPAEGKKVHGDLHMIDDTYIFNAVLSPTGKDSIMMETAWIYNTTTLCSEKAIIVEAEYFEKRGVIVFNEGYFNGAAKEYLA